MNDANEMRGRERGAGSRKLSILLLFIGLVSFLTLAKNSSNLPQSNPVRHLASASKMYAARSATVPNPLAAYKSAITCEKRNVRTERLTLGEMEFHLPSASWLDHPSLRSPPSYL
jgi:hypothetical protein